MLGGSDEAQKHIPTLTRQWLKDISVLPTVKSVRQKDRKKHLFFTVLKHVKKMIWSIFFLDAKCHQWNGKHNDDIYVITNFAEEKKETDTITVSSKRDDVPTELYSLVRWILVGSEEQLQTEMRSGTVDRSAFTILHVCQNIMYTFKTRRQVQRIPRKASDTFQIPHSRENPQERGLALTVHHDTRNKMLFDLFHKQNYCV